MTRHARHEDEQPDGDRVEELTEDLGGYNVLFGFIARVVTPVLATLFVICFIPWCVWVTRGVFLVDGLTADVATNRATIEQIQSESKTTFEAIRCRFESLPPADWRARIEKLEEFDRANTADHMAIKLMLESIRVKLGITPADGPQ